MTAHKPVHLVPKLRFAEFVDELTWECLPLKKLAKRITQRNTQGADLRALTNSAEHGVVDQREYFDRDIARNTDNYFIAETGDYVYNPRKSSTAPVGPISRNQIGTGVVSPLYTVFRFRSEANDFYVHYFRSSHWHGYLRRVSNSGARHDRMAITNDDLMAMPIPSPSPREQQKIADSLGNLDNLIAAEVQKLEALRQYKQGLMQQIFPQPGETMPRLRFPEFREADKWEEKKIGDLSEVKASGDLDVAYFSNFQSMTHLYPVYSNAVENEGLYGYYSLPQYKKNSVTITARGTLGIAFLRNHEFMGIGRLIVISDLRNLDPYFLKECWNHLAEIPREVTSIPQLTAIAVRTTVLPIPRPAEQQRIAKCLSSLEDVLAAQARKIDALKRQKQGLLQQLFPSLETE